jgi:hypothetical protein
MHSPKIYKQTETTKLQNCLSFLFLIPYYETMRNIISPHKKTRMISIQTIQNKWESNLSKSRKDNENVISETYHTQNIFLKTYNINIILAFLWKPIQDISPTLFDHISHTIFEDKIHNPMFTIIDNHSIDTKRLKCFGV